MGGGAGNATQQTARELASRGHVVHVLTSRLKGEPDVDVEGNLTVYRVFSKRRSIHEAGLFGAITYILAAFPRLRTLARANEYDVYHFYFGLPTGLLSLYVRWVIKRPYLVALRGSDVPGYDNTTWYLRPLHLLLRPMSRNIWSKAGRVTALTRHLEALARVTMPKLSIEIVGNGVNRRAFPYQPRIRQGSSLRLICVCRLVRRKGLDHLISAMAELRSHGAHLQIIGTGELEDDLRQLVKDKGLDDCIDLVGYVPREDLWEYYNSADIFVLPSLSESFGQVLLEAMSCGLPIVASRVGGIAEVVDSGSGGLLVEPASSTAIVHAVRTLAAAPQRRRAMSKHNLKQVSEKYCWSVIANRYEQLYTQVLSTQVQAAER